MSVVRRCPLDRRFPYNDLCETNSFLKSVPWKEVSAIEDVCDIEDVRYREVLKLYFAKSKYFSFLSRGRGMQNWKSVMSTSTEIVNN